jgi:hypothetical protein
VTVNVAERVAPPKLPEIETSIEAATAVVVTVKVAVVAFAGMVTEEATAPAGLLLLNVTSAPPAGAGAVIVAVPSAVPPPVTVAGESVMLARLGAGVSTVNDALREDPLSDAVMVATPAPTAVTMNCSVL